MMTNTIARSILSLILVALCACIAAPALARNHALLIGVAAYDDPSNKSLQGPRNDVILIWRLLTARGFAKADIRVLAEGLPERPDVPAPHAPANRAEILAGFDHLAAQAGPNDFVIVHFSGHGSTQPERDPANNPEPEPGGRDQVLLPKDAGQYDPALKSIRNAVVDDEFGAALDRIRAKGATVWAIIDACHAGTATRSSAAVVTRSVDPASLGVPEAIAQPLPPAAPERGGLVKRLAPEGKLIGFFAVDSWAEAIEREFPGRGEGFVTTAGVQRFGVFTWHLARALDSGRAQTFRDLARLISLDMASAGGQAQAPLPVFDGHLDLGLFGGKADGPRRFPAKIDGDEILIDAGGLNGFDVGAVVGVFDGPLADARRITGAQVKFADATTSQALLSPAAAALPATAWISIETPGVEFRYRVGVGEEAADETRALLERALAQKDEAQGLNIEIARAGDADIAARLIEGSLWLVPEGQQLARDQSRYDRSFAIPVAGRPREDVAKALRAALTTFARAANLVRLASIADGESGNDVKITLERVRETDAGRLADVRRDCGAGPAMPSPASAISSGSPAAFGHCDRSYVRISNQGARIVDVGVFFVDPMGSVSPPAEFRKNAGCVLALDPKATRPLEVVTNIRTWANGKPSTSGQWRILVFALPRASEQMPPNLCQLLQPSVEQARVEVALRNGPRASGFAALLERAALLDPTLRMPPPSAAEDNAGATVRQFVLDILPPHTAK